MSRIISGASLALVLFFSAGAFDALGSQAWAAELPPPPLTAAAIEPKIKITPKITSKNYQNNLPQTLCVGGQVSSAHSSDFSGKSGKLQLCKFSYMGTSSKNYEEIRLAPPSVGGNPSDPRNLWPKRQISAWDAAQKERGKFVTSRMVCTQEITLAEIQQAISANLIEVWKKLCIVRVTFFISL
jgi:hypothetical protein